MWTTPAFTRELCAFVGSAVTGAAQIRLVRKRPWSAVWRVEAGGTVGYAKQNCPGQAHEARLVSRLATLAPGYVVPVVAADSERDLLLTEDLGPTLDESEGGDVDRWCRVVTAAAYLQRQTAGRLDEVGLTSLPPGDATTYVADAAGRLGALPADDPRRLAPEAASRVQALLPVIARWAEEVEDLALPLTLLHNDLHTGNVVEQEGRLRFFDFGDAVLAEPLGNLLVPLMMAGHELDAAPDDPRLWRIADAALEVWSDLVPLRELRAALPAALRLARLARVESWRRCVASMTPSEHAEYGSAPAAWLAMLTDDPPLGASAH